MKMSIRSVEYATLRTSVDIYESSCYWVPDLAFHALGGIIGVKECLVMHYYPNFSKSWGFAVYRLVEKIVLLLNSGAGSGRYFAVTSNAQDYFGFLHNGSSYNTFPAEIVKKQPKSELVHEHLLPEE
ncbi:uncharacterized protein [Populus alba]|uniref:uncharacterized protein isoform X2 n=1 Tax=Populus alba TaxID=43335 RepID=UPI003CC720DC